MFDKDENLSKIKNKKIGQMVRDVIDYVTADCEMLEWNETYYQY